MYIFVAGMASVLFVGTGWRTTCRASTRPHVDSGREQAEPTALAAVPFPGHIDRSLEMALKRLRSIIAARRIALDLAICPDLATRLTHPALADILEELVRSTIYVASTERLLLTAWKSAGRIAFRILDDVDAADQGERQSRLGDLPERLATLDGTLDIDVQANGTIVTMWLPASDWESGDAVPLAE